MIPGLGRQKKEDPWDTAGQYVKEIREPQVLEKDRLRN